MLILHSSLHILVAHGSHDGSQVSGSLQNPGAVIVPSTIEDKIFGKPSFDPGFAKSLRHCGEMSRLGAFRWENPSFAFSSAPLFKNLKHASAHRYASPSFFSLAVRHEDHAGSTAVTVNGVAATSFKVVSDTYMTAVVPTGATTGPVVVTTPKGTLTSNRTFRIVQ